MYKFSDFISPRLKIESWDDLSGYFDDLLRRRISGASALKEVIFHYNELLSVFWEAKARAYIDMTCHTDNAAFVSRHEQINSVINPQVEIARDAVHRRLLLSPYLDRLPGRRYGQLKRILRRQQSLFRPQNVPLMAELSQLSSEYEQITGALSVTVRGQEITLPQARAQLEAADRELRRETFFAVAEKRQSIKPGLDKLFDAMVRLRHEVALNAGYRNFRDFQHAYLNRFDYSPQDALDFHRAVKNHVVPLAGKIMREHAIKLGLENDYRPWDVLAPPPNEQPLKPFRDGQELLEKTLKVFEKLSPEFCANLKIMQDASLLDLETRKNKAPGGYNYPLESTGMPFIFMNAAGTHDDMVTLMHEGGHAMHTFLTNDEPLLCYRETPSEMAETASMGMELMSSSEWAEFYGPNELPRAIREHREGIVTFLPWCMIVDAFQHELYLNPGLTPAGRDDVFAALARDFDTGIVRWEGCEEIRRNDWQRQLHIFTLPFYYIEYGIAQLGALQIYRNFKQDRKRGLELYKRGLTLGASRPMPEIWQAMGIRFDFGEGMIRELMAMLAKEI